MHLEGRWACLFFFITWLPMEVLSSPSCFRRDPVWHPVLSPWILFDFGSRGAWTIPWWPVVMKFGYRSASAKDFCWFPASCVTLTILKQVFNGTFPSPLLLESLVHQLLKFWDLQESEPALGRVFCMIKRICHGTEEWELLPEEALWSRLPFQTLCWGTPPTWAWSPW